MAYNFERPNGAPINSPVFTGTPTSPTPAVSDNSLQIANTAFVQSSYVSKIAAMVESQGLAFNGGYILGSTNTGPASGPFTIFGALRNEDLSGFNTTLILGVGLTLFSQNNLNDIKLYSAAQGVVTLGSFPDRAMNIFVVWRGSDGIIRCEINGVNTGITSSAAYNWVNWSSICGESGVQKLSGALARLGIANCDFTATERATLVSRGLVTLPHQRGGSMTALNTNAFANTGYTGFSGESATGFTASKSIGGAEGNVTSSPSFVIRTNQRFRVTFNLTLTSGVLPNFLISSGAGGLIYSENTTSISGANSFVLTTNSNVSAAVLRFYTDSGSATNFTVSNILIIPLGTLYEQGDCSRDAGFQILDSSGNNRHTELPESGVSIINPSDSSTIRYTLASDGWIIGDRRVIPINHVIDHVLVRATSGTPTFYMGSTVGASDVVPSISLTTAWSKIPDPSESSTGKLHVTRSTGTVQVIIVTKLAPSI